MSLEVFNRTPYEFFCFFRFPRSCRLECHPYSGRKVTANPERWIFLYSFFGCYPILFTIRTIPCIHSIPVLIDIFDLNSSMTRFTMWFSTVSSSHHWPKIGHMFLNVTSGTNFRTLLNRFHLSGPVPSLCTNLTVRCVTIFVFISFIKFRKVFCHMTFSTLLWRHRVSPDGVKENIFKD